jgi:parvulin-like peptidyl-prolyl isomerase
MVSLSSLSLESEQILDFMKRQVGLKSVCRKVLRQRVINQAALEQGIELTEEEIQAEADEIRLKNRLESAEATYKWLADQMITPDDWEKGICDRLLSQKLAYHMFDSEVDKYFAQHKLDFEQLVLYSISVPYQQLAQEIYYQVEEREISFYEAAHLYDVYEERRLRCGYDGKVRRWSLDPDIAAALFSVRPREIIGPVQVADGFSLLMVEEIMNSSLTAEVRQQILDQMFNEWVDREVNYIILHAEPVQVEAQS